MVKLLMKLLELGGAKKKKKKGANTEEVIRKKIKKEEREKHGRKVSILSSQPQRITSRLKAMFNLSPIYAARKPSNHKLFKNHKISPVHKFT